MGQFLNIKKLADESMADILMRYLELDKPDELKRMIHQAEP